VNLAFISMGLLRRLEVHMLTSVEERGIQGI
jgi:hypothetical protein